MFEVWRRRRNTFNFFYYFVRRSTRGSWGCCTADRSWAASLARLGPFLWSACLRTLCTYVESNVGYEQLARQISKDLFRILESIGTSLSISLPVYLAQPCRAHFIGQYPIILPKLFIFRAFFWQIFYLSIKTHYLSAWFLIPLFDRWLPLVTASVWPRDRLGSVLLKSH